MTEETPAHTQEAAVVEARKRGRPTKYNRAMTPAERQNEYKSRLRENGGIDFRMEVKDPDLARLFVAVKKKKQFSSNKATGEFIINSYLAKLKD